MRNVTIKFMIIFLVIFNFYLITSKFSIKVLIANEDRMPVIENAIRSIDATQVEEKLTVPLEAPKRVIKKLTTRKKKRRTTTIDTTPAKNLEIGSYLSKYPFLLDCPNNQQNKWTQVEDLSTGVFNDEYAMPAPNQMHSERILRAVLLFFPIELVSNFEFEFKWFYKSWIEMQKHEPVKWRTDIILFMEKDLNFLREKGKFLSDLGCSFDNRRQNRSENPMCTLIEYTPINKRHLETWDSKFTIVADKYIHLLDKVNIFDDDESNLDLFYTTIKKSLKKYGYADSILMAFDGYEYFQSAGYDYLIRSDMDVFLTPLFSIWLPKHCNDLNVGNGAYSNEFNVKRLERISKGLNLKYAKIWNLGSTWYSTPNMFRITAYLTLVNMAYISDEEFSQPERDGKVGTLLWPEWHYGVLLLYGQNVGLNHLIATKQANVVKIDRILDFHSTSSESIHTKIHIHVYHNAELFSKFAFKMGKYDNMTVQANQTSQIKYYCLKLALEGKRSSNVVLFKELQTELVRKG